LPLRVLTPLRRIGEGSGEFAPISWDDAITRSPPVARIIAARRRGDPAFSYAGSMGQVQFFRAIRCSMPSGERLERSICTSTGTRAGGRGRRGHATTPSRWSGGARDPVGVNASYSTINVMTLVKEARAAGVRRGHRSLPDADAQQADEHLMCSRTDAALALAIMHVWCRGADRSRLHRRATLGFEKLAST